MDRRMDRRDRRLGEWMMNDGWMDRRVDTWMMDGWMDQQMDGRESD